MLAVNFNFYHYGEKEKGHLDVATDFYRSVTGSWFPTSFGARTMQVRILSLRPF